MAQKTGFRAVVIFVVLFVSCMLLAQQQSDPTTPPNNAAALGVADDGQSEAPPSAAEDQESEKTAIAVLRGAATLKVEPGYIKVGPLHLSSVNLTQGYDSFDSDSQSAVTQNITVFSTDLFYAKTFKRRSQIALQYAPQVIVVDGKVIKDFASQALSFDTAVPVTPRLTIRFGDAFYFSGNQSRFLLNGMQMDFNSGRLVQNDVLERPGNWMSNSVSFTADYQFGARTHLAIRPDFGYLYVNNSFYTNRGQSYGGSISVSRDLSPNTSAGISYSAHTNAYTGYVADAIYQSFGISVNRRFGPTWRVSALLAAATVGYSSRQNWAPEPTVSVMKQFRRSSLSMAYMRTSAFYGHLHGGFSDQVDAAYQTQLTRRLTVTLGGGRYGEIWSLNRDSAKYARAAVGYTLFGNLRWFGSYIFRRQSGSPTDVLVGDRMTVMAGLQWVPGRTAEIY